MARKPRIHYPGAFYHVILRGNSGRDIFFSKKDRTKFYLLLQEGTERFEHRIHAFCLMTNHVHLVVQVGVIPLSKIMQNVTFRYTRYINIRKKQIGHLFQGRYKAILVDADNYLLELVRYIHNNPVRAQLTETADQYTFSSHQAYLGKNKLPWLTTDFVLTQFSKQKKRALKLYSDFIMKGSQEDHRQEFYRGLHEGRILGDERFSEKVLAKAAEKYSKKLLLEDVVEAVCFFYNITIDILAEPGKERPASEARAIASLLVQEYDNLRLTELGSFLKRDLATLSQAANRLRKRAARDKILWAKIESIRKTLQ
jgi:REP element-mobilizing transposase RayT